VPKSVEKYAIKFFYFLKPPKSISKVCYEKCSMKFFGNNLKDLLIFIRMVNKDLKHLENLGPIIFITFNKLSHTYRDV